MTWWVILFYIILGLALGYFAYVLVKNWQSNEDITPEQVADLSDAEQQKYQSQLQTIFNTNAPHLTRSFMRSSFRVSRWREYTAEEKKYIESLRTTLNRPQDLRELDSPDKERGAVMVVEKDFMDGTAAYVALNMLRHYAPTLHVEVWGLDPVYQKSPIPLVRYCTSDDGVKVTEPYALQHSAFKKILLLSSQSFVVSARIMELFDMEAPMLFPSYWACNGDSAQFKKALSSDQNKLLSDKSSSFGLSLWEPAKQQHALSLWDTCLKEIDILGQRFLFSQRGDMMQACLAGQGVQIRMNKLRPGGCGYRNQNDGQYMGNTIVHATAQTGPIVLERRFQMALCYVTRRPQWVEYWSFMRDNARGSVAKGSLRFEFGVVNRQKVGEVFTDDPEAKIWQYLEEIRNDSDYKAKFNKLIPAP